MGIIGYFMQDEIYYKGKKQPLRKTEIYYVDSGLIPLENRKSDDKINVMDKDGDWFTIKVSEFIKNNEGEQ